MSESDATDARVSIWRVERIWMLDRARAAFEAEGRRARDGRVIVVRLYETPYGQKRLHQPRPRSSPTMWIGKLTVRSPRDIVPTNLVMLIGDTILSEGFFVMGCKPCPS